MVKNLKTWILVAVTGLLFSTPLLVPAVAAACGNSVASGISTGVNDATGSADCGSTSGSDVTTGIASIAKTAVSIFSILVGIIAVIMIIYGGFRYITSGGDSGKVGNAKNTLIYAIVGLVIVALAQLIVHYVLSESNTVNTETNNGSIYLVEPRL
jgi:threonine/homoserine/homoserine lactone efflux protein